MFIVQAWANPNRNLAWPKPKGRDTWRGMEANNFVNKLGAPPKNGGRVLVWFNGHGLADLWSGSGEPAKHYSLHSGSPGCSVLFQRPRTTSPGSSPLATAGPVLQQDACASLPDTAWNNNLSMAGREQLSSPNA